MVLGREQLIRGSERGDAADLALDAGERAFGTKQGLKLCNGA